MRYVRLISGGIAVGVLAGWLYFSGSQDRPTAVTEPENHSGRAAAPLQVVENRAAQPPVLVARPAAHPGQIEVCGLGWVDKPPDDEQTPAFAKKFDEFIAPGRHEIAARLLSDPDSFSQAVGLIVKTYADADDRRRDSDVDAKAQSCGEANCSDSDARAKATAHLANNLALRAIQTLDARVYALAFKTCDTLTSLSRKTPEACSFLSTQQWSRIDPDNGAPWLYTLHNTPAENKSAVVNEALFHIANAKRYDDRYFATMGEIARHANDTDHATAGALTASFDAIRLSSSLAPVQSLLVACSEVALKDPNRRQLCEGVADALVNRSDTFLMALMGAAIGRYLGWEHDPADRLRGLQSALAEATPALFGPAADEAAMSCRVLKNHLQRFVRQAEVGEIGSAREWITANGKTEAAYTKKAREDRLQREAELRANAAGAAVPAPASAASRKHH